MKQNPAYKGKWHAPMIDNPSYKGIWKPQEIPNPEYFELHKPVFDPIAATGIEIWTMQDGILFDNIVIADDEKAPVKPAAEVKNPSAPEADAAGSSGVTEEKEDDTAAPRRRSRREIKLSLGVLGPSYFGRLGPSLIGNALSV
ncbi:hypothetical protein QYE76_020149 [Lolium multiflorum]|uniref:Calnexin n=1 Tax=Lolium multiflorum TaxID=4521 RepID=A0AAD8R5C5_LOLMU|nr:hypothetical protein QYE76_020149 [Lolium multiflorum]